jgi:hypothetical protein
MRRLLNEMQEDFQKNESITMPLQKSPIGGGGGTNIKAQEDQTANDSAGSSAVTSTGSV